MLLDIIMYCALNTTTGNDIDSTDNLVERLFDAITNAPDPNVPGAEVMSWEAHLKRQNRATIPYTIQSLAFFHKEWAEGFLGWHAGDCDAGTYVVRWEECEMNWRWRECLTDLEWSPRWGARKNDLNTCCHE